MQSRWRAASLLKTLLQEVTHSASSSACSTRQAAYRAGSLAVDACSTAPTTTPACTRSLHSSGPSHAASGRDPERDAEDLLAQLGVKPPGQASAAREVMEDPFSRLLASRGMPLGMSFDGPKGKSQVPGDDDAEADSLGRAPASGQGYQMEALDEMVQAASRLPSGSPADQLRQQQQVEGSWGTTSQSPAEIARRIAESNADLERMAAEADAELAAREADSGPEEFEQISADEAKFSTLEGMSRNIKDLDEVWEILASVPWLDEAVLSEKELKGVAQVGLLGTLEEVGFNIRTQLQRIWAGERDDSIITEGALPKEQAALISILYHTKQLEDKYGPPPSLEAGRQ